MPSSRRSASRSAVRAIHQFLPIVEPGAVTSHTLVAQRVLRDAGYESEIFTSLFGGDETFGAHPIDTYRHRARPDDLLVYQMAIGSAAADFVLSRPEQVVVNHHNLTPLQYFAGWEPVAAHGVVWGRQQLRRFAERGALGIPVSRYNDADLIEAGFETTTVVPFLIDDGARGVAPEPAVRAQLAATRRGTECLFVGRIAANKAQQDVVKAFAAFRKFHDPDARLHLVGGGDDTLYGYAVRSFAAALGLEDAVVLTGPVPPAALAAYYEAADVFVVLSEHEGFCVPLVEAMLHEVPIVAFSAAAVPETLGDAGVLLTTKDACTVAAAVARVASDNSLRAAMTARGLERAAHYDVSRTGPAFVAALERA
jgi:glycosyltransferase involved in cell wall biosynthesis